MAIALLGTDMAVSRSSFCLRSPVDAQICCCTLDQVAAYGLHNTAKTCRQVHLDRCYIAMVLLSDHRLFCSRWVDEKRPLCRFRSAEVCSRIRMAQVSADSGHLRGLQELSMQCMAFALNALDHPSD